MDPTGIFFLYVIASPQAECQARVNVNATHGTKTRVAYVSLHLMGSSRSIYPAGITIGIFELGTILNLVDRSTAQVSCVYCLFA